MTNYTKGRAYEYKVMAQLRKEGWPVVLRTAGSHGLFDLIAIQAPLKEDGDTIVYGHIIFIQCKTGKTKKRAISEVEKSNIKKYEGLYSVSVEVV